MFLCFNCVATKIYLVGIDIVDIYIYILCDVYNGHIDILMLLSRRDTVEITLRL